MLNIFTLVTIHHTKASPSLKRYTMFSTARIDQLYMNHFPKL